MIPLLDVRVHYAISYLKVLNSLFVCSLVVNLQPPSMEISLVGGSVCVMSSCSSGSLTNETTKLLRTRETWTTAQIKGSKCHFENNEIVCEK